MVSIASTPEKITADWLTIVFRDAGVLTNENVTVVEHKVIGTGKMGDNVRLTISYDSDCNAPATLVAKLPASDETTRAIAGVMAAYTNEVMFYRHLAERTTMSTAKIYANEVSDDGTDFVIVMEDLAPAEPGSQLVGESLGNSKIALQEAAKLAASFYGDQAIGELAYVTSAARADGGAQGAELLEQYWPQFVDRFGHSLSPECLDFGGLFSQKFRQFTMRYTGPKTLIHGDYRCENILFNAQTATVVDWQTACESSALADAAYFLGGSVDIDNRRQWERSLIDKYASWLNSAGVKLSSAECWEQYREFSMHGIMITVLGAVFTAAEERSDKMFLTMIQRHLQQCVDLNAAEFLG